VPLTCKLVMLSNAACFGPLMNFLTQKDHQNNGDHKDPSDECPLQLSNDVKFLDLEPSFNVFKCGCEVVCDCVIIFPFLKKVLSSSSICYICCWHCKSAWLFWCHFCYTSSKQYFWSLLISKYFTHILSYYWNSSQLLSRLHSVNLHNIGLSILTLRG